jgi:hypothetical protein
MEKLLYYQSKKGGLAMVDERPFYSLSEACQDIGMSLATYHYRRKRGDKIPLPDLRIGRRVYYSAAHLEALRHYYQANREWQRPVATG